MKLQAALDLFLVQLEADGRSPHTRNQYQRHVRAFIAWLAPRDDVADVGHEDIAAFLASRSARQRPDGGVKCASSMNSLRTSLRRFFAYCHESGLISENPARLVRRALTGPPLPRALSSDEQERLLAVLEGAPRRDRVLFRLMLSAGLRVGSAVALDIGDVDIARRELRLRSAKGDREERVPLPQSISEDLATYIGDKQRGALFAGQHGSAMSVRHAQRLYSRFAQRAGIRCTRTHSLRHSFATRLYERTSDVLLVQRALTHRSIQSTMVYARCDDRRLRGYLDA